MVYRWHSKIMIFVFFYCHRLYHNETDDSGCFFGIRDSMGPWLIFCCECQTFEGSMHRYVFIVRTNQRHRSPANDIMSDMISDSVMIFASLPFIFVARLKGEAICSGCCFGVKVVSFAFLWFHTMKTHASFHPDIRLNLVLVDHDYQVSNGCGFDDCLSETIDCKSILWVGMLIYSKLDNSV